MQRAVALVVTLVWAATAAYAIATGDSAPLMYASGVMVIAASWIFTLKGFEFVKRDNDG